MTENGETLPEVIEATRGPDGRWLPGNTGNVHGVRSRVGRWRDVFDAEIDESKARALIGKTYELAIGGDVKALGLLLARLVPELRAVEPVVQLQPLSGSLTTQGAQILAATADGTLTPSQGSQMLVALGAQARALEVDELVRRMDALEAGRGKETVT